MYRIIAILLMPFFVVGNALAHTHGVATHLSTSEGRAHIHIGDTSPHDHSHGRHTHSHRGHAHSHANGHKNGQASDQNRTGNDSGPALLAQPTHHDSDAIYVGASDALVTTFDRTLIKTDSFGVVEIGEDNSAGIRPPIHQHHFQHAVTAKRRLFLLHAALRL